MIATIFICIFNYRSAKTTREQLAETKRQLEEKDMVVELLKKVKEFERM